MQNEKLEARVVVKRALVIIHRSSFIIRGEADV
jgi:hypothetical protein